ncbi:MAG: hypothetical protein QG653_363 [Patescibacteria group bacterium]|nr:hypothetical protein [Patescibacteria group bacterium]
MNSSPSQPDFVPVERNQLGVRNEMQVRLANLGGQSFDEYLATHAEEFKNLVEENPGLFDKYEENQEKTLDEIKKIIYH